MMKITLQEFLTELRGARLIDQQQWTSLQIEKAMMEQWRFDDDGAYYLEGEDSGKI